ncbi:pantoate--beta-alanine ligase [Microbacterium sp. cx-55]|uniref:pantoate--beta-alanine ligase n=1 Tax=unclassified Microbacterium TaxID=2609290 RepID=UPI001CBCD2E0|nr:MULTISPECIES: pantoate--beta-alanine ligase [unclassified Microbacterium]MBZ4487433.1 pantoate--beta-alanine ligase [Microbacterium sp. cx-55]MCC4908436.1 pantoate--beta-alanine ligase [Microbacterium sp. cx-59]UGB35453.1 pantoate--beta-alanine ligase [Microbacterium sp. cx-55]
MIRSLPELRTRLADARAAAPGSRVALVSTIGALHDGHIDLIRAAQENADIVVVSLFVNPLRFRTVAEYEAYPRTPEADAELLERLGVDIAFAPDAAELLPTRTSVTKVSAGDLGLRYEGRTRPFYFDGLLTVEAILFHLVAPDVAVYGQRDRQRAFLVRRMARDLFFDVDVIDVETARSADGLPLSTRLDVLEPADRSAATLLVRALEAAASNADRDVDACIAAAQSALMGENRIRLEYLNVVDPATFLPVDEGHRGPALALIAATVGTHRFIDNAEIYIR